MPRRGPIDPHGYYHVSTRGNFGAPLYQTVGEHELYLELYAKYAAQLGWDTLAWALMWNHNHFLVKLHDGGLSEGMRAINHGFARRLNSAYGRTGKGHLVRHCFYAGPLASDEQIRTVCRYIDLNAVRAKQCHEPEAWPWSGYAATLGLARRRPFHSIREQLAFFGSRRPVARERYARFVADTRLPGRVTEAQRAERAA